MIENWDYNEKNALEIWDIYDKDKTKVGYTKHRSEKLNDFEYHLVVRVWIVNSDKEILLSQRGMKKRGPLLWECTAGSAISGENNIDTINREVFEELGIDLSHDKGICMLDVRRDSHHDFYEVWLYRKDIDLSDIVIDGEDVINVKWVKIDELLQMMKENQLMPTLSNFPDLYRKYVQKDLEDEMMGTGIESL